tara:strand:- start:58 stop:456 length:399 start_codon:yes stop_codon:yes gene_type:complete
MDKVACVILINGENQLLAYLRDDKQSIPFPNNWAVLGGHVEEGETILEALKRELKEEIDYDVQDPVFIKEFDDRAGCLVYVYRANIDKKLTELTLTEGQKLGYFSFEEFITLTIPEAFREFLIKHKERILIN